MIRLTLTPVGSSTGVILPEEILSRLRVGQGDVLYAVETPDGVELKICEPEFCEQMEQAQRVMREDRDALRKLAE